MRLNHAVDALTRELDAVRDRSNSVNLGNRGDNSIKKRRIRRKGFKKFTDYFFKEKSIADCLRGILKDALQTI